MTLEPDSGSTEQFDDPDHPLEDADAVHGYVSRVCFKTGPPGRVGAELEWLTAPRDDPGCPPDAEALRHLTRNSKLPAGSRLSLEPGGQLELSSSPAADVTECLQRLDMDLDLLLTLLDGQGLALVGSALDPVRPPRRLLHTPRYDAMAHYFGRLGENGAVMMNSTAACQVNLEAGTDDTDMHARWSLLHDLGPVLSAAFANSPVHRGRHTGWKSTRQRVWQAVEPAHVQPPTGPDPVGRFAEFALDAPVMVIRRRHQWVAAPGLTFREWVSGPHSSRPTTNDLAYHLTTLFPPVRPRGWFEVRYLDAQPRRWWPVPIAVLAALTDHPEAADRALHAAEPVRHHWVEAARDGLADPALASAAVACFEAALTALRPWSPRVASLVDDFAESYVARGRSPADDPVGALPNVQPVLVGKE